MNTYRIKGTRTEQGRTTGAFEHVVVATGITVAVQIYITLHPGTLIESVVLLERDVVVQGASHD